MYKCDRHESKKTTMTVPCLAAKGLSLKRLNLDRQGMNTISYRFPSIQDGRVLVWWTLGWQSMFGVGRVVRKRWGLNGNHFGTKVPNAQMLFELLVKTLC